MRSIALLAVSLLVLSSTQARAQENDLLGLWASETTFAAALQGELSLRRAGQDWSASLGGASQLVRFDELLHQAATRVVVVSPEHAVEDFLTIVEKMGLHKVSYNVGWTAWLDIAPEGVNKATALERVRGWLGIPRSRVMAVGDGRNDIDMLRWAAEAGRGVAMGQAPEEVAAVASERTGTDLEDGVAALLRGI